MRIALDTDRVSLLEGDSLEVLHSLADKSVDVSIFDPPYHEHVHAKLGKERRNDGHKARAALTFPPMTPAMIVEVMREIVRVTKTWILNFSDFYYTHLWGEACVAAGGAWVRTGQWVKTNPMPQMTSDRPATGSEDIVICHASSDAATWGWFGKGHAATWRGRRDQAFTAPGVLDDEGEPYSHPNQKPAWLLQSLLGMFVPPGGLVLDPYIGSGSILAGALATERLEGESPYETTCPKCAKKILELYQPPLPQGVRVLGSDGDPKCLDLSMARIRAASPALLAA